MQIFPRSSSPTYLRAFRLLFEITRKIRTPSTTDSKASQNLVCKMLHSYLKTVSVILTRFKKNFPTGSRPHVRSAVDEELLPDLWSEAKAASESSSSNSFESHEVFTEDEKAKVKLAINNFRILLVQQFEPNPQQLASVNDQLEYLVAAVDRLNKFDWKGVATSTLIGISTALTLDVERSRHLYGLFQQAFSSVLRLLN